MKNSSKEEVSVSKDNEQEVITSRSRRQEFSFEEYYIKVGKLFPQRKVNEGCRKCSGITWKGVKVGRILTVKLNLEIKRD